ncbi:cupin domain-containing protein [Roseomonas sp. CCTCC AB2023176]|uniref:cupin domain-containing protein n=1 Tax=Roseomonas sp. CCTCC AB2023176 TaxID=3342640 RepID=UPI0035DAF245
MADGEGLRMAGPGDAVPFEIPGAEGAFRIQILNEDRARGVVTSIVHLPAGGRIPAHYHDAGSEMHYVLEGDLIERGETLGAGAFLTHAKGVVHGPHESRGGAKVLTVQTWQSEGGEFDFRPADEGAAARQPPRGPAANDRGPTADAIGPADDAQTPQAARGADTQEEAAEERGNAKGYS